MAVCRSKWGRWLDAVRVDKSAERHELNCGSWRCPRCKQKWAKKWAALIGETLKYAQSNRVLLLNLTTAEMTEHTAIEDALRWFIKRIRAIYGDLEYVKVVEYNRRQTQPHFHLILNFTDCYIPHRPADLPPGESFPKNMYDTFEFLWQEAMCFAAPENKITQVVWCQPPSGDNSSAAASYAVGYVTGRNGKDAEIPNETWKGRRITNSRGFFIIRTKLLWQQILSVWFSKPIEEIQNPPQILLVPKLGCASTYGHNGSSNFELARILKNPKIIMDSIVFRYLNRKPPDFMLKNNKIEIIDYY